MCEWNTYIYILDAYSIYTRLVRGIYCIEIEEGEELAIDSDTFSDGILQ